MGGRIIPGVGEDMELSHSNLDYKFIQQICVTFPGPTTLEHKHAWQFHL